MQGLYPLSNPSFLRPLCRLIKALLGSGFVIGYNYWQTAVMAQVEVVHIWGLWQCIIGDLGVPCSRYLLALVFCLVEMKDQ